MINKWKIKDLYRIFLQIEVKHGISIQLLSDLLLSAITRVLRSDIDPEIELEVSIDEQNGLKVVNKAKEVVDDSEYEEDYEKNPATSFFSVPLSEARKRDSKIKIGQTLELELNLNDLSPLLNTKILSAFKYELIKNKRDKIFNDYKDKISISIQAKLIEDTGKGAYFLLEDGNEAFMPLKYRNTAIALNKDINHLVIEEVLENPDKFNRSQILVSNSSIFRIKELFAIEVPEIQQGNIEIVDIARIPGIRSKISFRLNPEFIGDLDILGCVIGDKGARINAITEKLGGERFDIILFDDNIENYIVNSVSPSKVVGINKRFKDNDYLLIVPDKHFTLAIGKKGMNVKLAVSLTKKNLDICPYSKAIENNIKISWNGNVSGIDELNLIENSEGRIPRRFGSQNNNTRGTQYSFNKIDIENFEKEIADYQNEIDNFESNFEFNNEMFNSSNKQADSPEEKEEERLIEEVFDKPVVSKTNNSRETKIVEKNFKTDEDLLEDIDLSDFDFSDFDDE